MIPKLAQSKAIYKHSGKAIEELNQFKSDQKDAGSKRLNRTENPPLMHPEKRQKEELKEPSRKFSKILFNDVVYCIGEYLLLRETQKSTIVGRLVEIVPTGGSPSHPDWPMIKVQWHYRKHDLDWPKLGIVEEDLEFIGENEVFPSRHFDTVFADAIVSKC
jgi:hypothetical protein